mgnify:CR=1 FL=1
MLRTFLLTLGVLLWVPLPVFGSAANTSAEVWLNGCQAGRTVTAVQHNGFACWNPGATANAAPPILDTNACENYDVLIYDDVDGGGSPASSVVYSLYHCPTADIDYDNRGEALNGCTAFDVGGTITGSGSTLGAASSWFWVDTATTPSGDPRVIVRCNGVTR